MTQEKKTNKWKPWTPKSGYYQIVSLEMKYLASKNNKVYFLQTNELNLTQAIWELHPVVVYL